MPVLQVFTQPRWQCKFHEKSFQIWKLLICEKLEFRELAFLSLRAMVRCELVLANLYDRVLPVDHKNLFDELKQLLVEVVKSPPSVTKASEVLPWNLLATFKSAVKNLPAGSPERTCFLGAVHASRILPGKVADVIGWESVDG